METVIEIIDIVIYGSCALICLSAAIFTFYSLINHMSDDKLSEWVTKKIESKS